MALNYYMYCKKVKYENLCKKKTYGYGVMINVASYCASTDLFSSKNKNIEIFRISCFVSRIDNE